MQTAKLTINGRITTEFSAVLFLFRCRERPKPAEISAKRNLLGSFSLFIYFFFGRGGETLVLNMGEK